MVLILFIIIAITLLITYFCYDDADIKIGMTILFALVFLVVVGLSLGARDIENYNDVEKEYYTLIALADNKDYYSRYRVEVNDRIEKYNKKMMWERENQNSWFWNDFVNDDIVKYLDTIEIKGGE